MLVSLFSTLDCYLLSDALNNELLICVSNIHNMLVIKICDVEIREKVINLNL